MFCGKCGIKNADGAAFCSECGANLNVGQVVKSSTPVEISPSNKNRKIGMIAVSLIAVIIIVLVITIFGGRSYKATVEKFIIATFHADAETYLELLPEDMIAYALEEEGYDEDELDKLIEELHEELEDQLYSTKKYLDGDWVVSYEILTVEDVSGYKFKKLKNDYEKKTDTKISAAKTVEIEITIKTEETEVSNSLSLSLIKVGRSWYLDITSMGSIF